MAPWRATVTGYGPVTGWLRDDADPARRMTYYLGTHRPWWLRDVDVAVPLFVSAATLAAYKSRDEAWPVSMTGGGPWALDSGAFTALTSDNPDHPWHLHPDDYGGMVTRLMDDVGPPDFVATQDWCCEPNVLRRTGHTVRDHQEFSAENYFYLRDNFPFVPWAVPLQGWEPWQYLEHADMYEAAGVDLAAEHRVGLGSVCRRADHRDIAAVVHALADRGYQLHGYGVSIDGLRTIGHYLTSADSMAWSAAARIRGVRLPECERDQAHAGPCNNCPRWALRWREQALAALRGDRQLALF